MIIGLKMWPLQDTQGFSNIWPSDLVLDLTWLIFKLVQDFINPFPHNNTFWHPWETSLSETLWEIARN